jgi:hypothetical protein
MNNQATAVKVTEKQKKADVSTVVQPVKSSEVSEAKVIILKPTAEDRIRRLENFLLLTKKFQHLKTKKDELNAFLISSDGQKEKLVLKNSEGYILEVSNSEVIMETTKLMEKILDNLLAKAEKEVQEFEV